jgi:hypothetical protein
MRWFLLILGLTAVGLTLAGAPIHAHAAESNKATAEALFNEGRSLMAEGRYEEAIPKLEASQDLDPGLGTLLNLAECYERVGRTASAWAEYREVAALARQTGAREREQLAEQKSLELEPKLSKLAIGVAPGVDPTALRITRDGSVVRTAELGILIPVDPGTHTVEVTAPGKTPWSTSVEVSGNADSQSVEIPPLVDGSETSASLAGGEAGMPIDSGDEATSGMSTQKTLALVAGGVGLAGVVVGTIFGLKASSSWSSAKDQCASYPYDCGPEGKELEDDARSQATWSTIGFIVGGVGLAGGAALWFTADAGSQSTVGLAVGPTSVSVKGSF